MIEYLGEIEIELENSLACLSGAQMGSNYRRLLFFFKHKMEANFINLAFPKDIFFLNRKYDLFGINILLFSAK